MAPVANATGLARSASPVANATGLARPATPDASAVGTAPTGSASALAGSPQPTADATPKAEASLRWTSIATGAEHSCATTAKGQVWCWGRNQHHVLGDSTPIVSGHPVQVPKVQDASQVVAGLHHSCAVTRGGAVWCWGANAHGELGDGSTSARSRPVKAGITEARSLSAGGSHTCAIKRDGSLWCWGANGDQRLGSGPRRSEPTPQRVPGLTNVAQVSAGADHSCAVTVDGIAWCWGANREGQLGLGNRTQRAAPSKVPGLAAVSTIHAGDRVSCARQRTGHVLCWGRRVWTARNQALRPTPQIQLRGASAYWRSRDQQAYVKVRDLILTAHGSAVHHILGVDALAEISGGFGKHSCGLSEEGAAFCWGDNRYGQLGAGLDPDKPLLPVQVQNVEDATRVSAGSQHACALTSDGGVWCWGGNRSGQLGDDTRRTRYTPVPVVGLFDAVDLSVAGATSCAVTKEGAAYCWGANTFGVLGPGRDLANNRVLKPRLVQGATPLERISTSGDHTCALKRGGQAVCWGRNDLGQTGQPVGRPGRRRTLTPYTIPLKQVVDISVGGRRSCAVTADGAVYCWGQKSAADHAHRSASAPGAPRPKPERITPLEPMTRVAVGPGHVCAFAKSGAIWCWGSGRFCQLGQGKNRGSATPVQTRLQPPMRSVSVGLRHTCGLSKWQRARCWGRGLNGEIGDGARKMRYVGKRVRLPGKVRQVAAGHQFSCAVLKLGQVYCWGNPTNGRLGDDQARPLYRPRRVLMAPPPAPTP